MSGINGPTHATGLPGSSWVKSSYSGPTGGNCAEIAHLPGGRVAMRNSRHPGGTALVFTAAEWDAFLAGARDGEFDRPRALSPPSMRICRPPMVSVATSINSGGRERHGGGLRPGMPR